MKVHHIIPFSLEKDLGKAYNDAMMLIPDHEAAMFTDYDVMLLHPKQKEQIEIYANTNVDAIFTCFTNRIHQLSRQNYFDIPSINTDIIYHNGIAEKLLMDERSITELKENISGFLMVIPKDVWLRCSFIETGTCIGVDTAFFKKAISKGIRIFRMNNIYVFHYYRLHKSITDKSHL